MKIKELLEDAFDAGKMRKAWESGEMPNGSSPWETFDEWYKSKSVIISDQNKELVDYRWREASEKPPHAVQILVQHLTSNGLDFAIGVYHEDDGKYYYFHKHWEESIEVTHWKYIQNPEKL
jgi:hypothetical protein